MKAVLALGALLVLLSAMCNALTGNSSRSASVPKEDHSGQLIYARTVVALRGKQWCRDFNSANVVVRIARAEVALATAVPPPQGALAAALIQTACDLYIP